MVNHNIPYIHFLKNFSKTLSDVQLAVPSALDGFDQSRNSEEYSMHYFFLLLFFFTIVALVSSLKTHTLLSWHVGMLKNNMHISLPSIILEIRQFSKSVSSFRISLQILTCYTFWPHGRKFCSCLWHVSKLSAKFVCNINE